MTLEALRDLATSPIGAVGTVLTVLSGLVGLLDPILQLVSSTANLWFPAIAAFSRFMAPELSSVPDEIARKMLLLAVAVYVGVLASKIFDKAKEKLR